MKVTGAARYAADHRPERMLYSVLVDAPVPAGRVRRIDAAAARELPAVTHVLTHEDFPRLGAPPVPPASSSRLPLQDDEIRHDGEPVALVLAETLEDAEYGASLVRADVEPAAFIPHPRTERAGGAVPREGPYLFFGFSDFEHGDVDAALAGAAVRQGDELCPAIPSPQPDGDLGDAGGVG